MNARQHVPELVRCLARAYPDVRIPLRFTNPLQLLVATILSAQCTDERVNIVTGDLFRKYRTVDDYADADPRQLEQDIHSTGFYRAKARNIIGSARMLRERHGGTVPRTMSELVQLPGVARKTANVVLAHAYGVVEGIAVDTHVIRISRLLGLTRHTDPVRIEQVLMRLVPRNDWRTFSLLIQTLGRTVCIARRPAHARCPVRNLCPAAR